MSTLAARAGSCPGHGVNHEKEAFTGRLVVSPVLAGRALTLHYTALGLDGQKLHEEFTLLSQSDQGGLCLWPVMAELPAVMPYQALADPAAAGDSVALVFSCGRRDRFREEIGIDCRADGANPCRRHAPAPPLTMAACPQRPARPRRPAGPCCNRRLGCGRASSAG